MLDIITTYDIDCPVNKLLLQGRANLTNTELLQLLIGCGMNNDTSGEVSKKLMRLCNSDIVELGKLGISDLMTIDGIGEHRAALLLACFELGRRRQITDVKVRSKISSSRDAFQAIAPKLLDLRYEEFWILMLNRSNRIIKMHRVSTGGVAGTVVDAKMIFKPALEMLACSVILCHNHPSGNLKPSEADITLTEKLRQAGKSLDCAVLDHLIVADSGYYSFADEGLF